MTTLKRILLLGASGQVGRAVRRSTPDGYDVHAPTSREADVTRAEHLRDVMKRVQPDAIINCVAQAKVDDAEMNPERARGLNAIAPAAIANAAREHSARLVHLSTDYVFDGAQGYPYTPDAPTQPISVYGQSKLDGERAVLNAGGNVVVLRTAWVHSSHAPNFVRAVFDTMQRGDRMLVVDDQMSTPTRASNLATAIWRIVVASDMQGVHHFTDAGTASRYDVAVFVHELLARRSALADGASVRPVPSSTFPTPARRPLYSVLDKHDTWMALDWTPEHWSGGVERTVAELLDA